jgi:hypothetical protein
VDTFAGSCTLRTAFRARKAIALIGCYCCAGRLVSDFFCDMTARDTSENFYGLLMRFRNSWRVFSLDRIHPSMQLVVVVAPVFCTPRITIQRWLDSITTATPCGWSISDRASATCLVRRSCTWRRRANISAMRASLERPMTRRLGM